MLWRSLLGLSLALLPQAAASDITQLAPDRFLCEGGSGQGPTHDVSGFFAGNSIAARFTFLDENPHPHWATAGGILFRLDNGQAAGVMVVAPADNDRALWIVIKPPGSTETVGMATVRRTRVVELSATMNRGAIFVRAGNERGQINVGNAAQVARLITCSNGRFEIELTRRPRRSRPY